MKLVVVVCCTLIYGNSHAMFQCKDAHGKTSFQDQPCAAAQRIVVAPTAKGGGSEIPHIGSEEHIKGVADALNRQVEEKVKNDPSAVRRPSRTTPARPSSNTQSQPMPFEPCVVAVNRTAQQFGLGVLRAPIVLNSQDLYARRICTDTGSLLISCSRADQKMVTITSPYDPSTGCR